MVPVDGRASYVIFVHFCNVCQDPRVPGHPPGLPFGAVVRPGEHLASYVLVYQDGTEHCQAVRRRLEISDTILLALPCLSLVSLTTRTLPWTSAARAHGASGDGGRPAW